MALTCFVVYVSAAKVTATKHTTGSSSGGKQSETPGRKVKCKFWGKCYRKNDAHLKKYRHPTGEFKKN